MNAQELSALNKDRKITQLCFVTDDYKRTIEFLTKQFEWGPWHILINSSETAHDVYVMGEPSEEWAFYFALTSIGDLQIEVIQPIKGPGPYEKFLREKGPGLHHMKEGIVENEALLARIRQLEDLGNLNYYQGMYGDDIYCYFDVYKDLGAYYEIGNSEVGNVDLSTMPGYIGRYPEE